jgi:serine/threonine protein kinase
MIPEPGKMIHGRYSVKDILGQSAIGVTALATDEESGKPVVVKLLSLEKLQNWKQFDLFEREIRVLKGLRHPGIPAYIDSFNLEPERCIGLVQEYVGGADLDRRVKDGLRITEEEAVAMTRKLLGILEYMQSLHPPVIHRDVNPKNIVLDGAGEPFLVDFDSVHAAAGSESYGSDTAVGTFGYMPMDQIMGKITPAVDMYGLGVTILFLLTHKGPEEFPLRDSKIEHEGFLEVSPGFEGFIDALIEPSAEKRIRDAAAAIRVLDALARADDGEAEAFFDDEKPDPVLEEILGEATDAADPLGMPVHRTVKRVVMKSVRTISGATLGVGGRPEAEFFIDGQRVSEDEYQSFRKETGLDPIDEPGGAPAERRSDKIKSQNAVMFFAVIGAGILLVFGLMLMVFLR